MNNTKINIFKRFFYSLTSFDKYRLFLRQNTGKAVVYLLLLSILVSLAIFIPAGIQYNNFMRNFITNFDSIVPDFTFSNGKLQVYGEMPIVFDDEDYPIVIDTSADAEERILKEYDIIMLITSDKIIQKHYVNKSVTNLSAFQGITLTRDDIADILPIMQPFGKIMFVLLGIGFVCGKFFSVLIISLIGLIINSAAKTNLSYRNIFKISVYSITMPLLICTIMDLLPVLIPFKWFIFYAIATVYVYGAINSIKREIYKINNPENMNSMP